MPALSYSDVYLKPKYSTLKSRSEADISVEFLGRKFESPILPANMSSVINEDIAKWLSENNYFYIYHRFGDTYKFIKKATDENWKTISISIGVNESYETLDYLTDSDVRVDFITIDVAHGHSYLVEQTICLLRAHFGEQDKPLPKIIAGNVATLEAVKDLSLWGADAVKVGIAGGAACSTKNQTGFHVPMFTCVNECSKIGVPIISDGGIRENGDFSKALVAGATMVMAGSIFAACIDAPGENVYENIYAQYNSGNGGIAATFLPKLTRKKYFGSASAKQKGENKHVEGFEVNIPCNGLTYKEKYQEVSESLKSAVSYGGGNNLEAFRTVEFLTTK